MACNLAVIRGAQLATSRDLTPLSAAPDHELVGISAGGVSNDLIENGSTKEENVPFKETHANGSKMVETD